MLSLDAKRNEKRQPHSTPPHALTLPRNTPALPPRRLPGAWRDNSFPRGLLLEPIRLPCAGCFHPWTIQENHKELIRSHQFKPNVALYPSDNIPASLPVGYDVTHINGRAKPARSPSFENSQTGLDVGKHRLANMNIIISIHVIY